MTKSGDGIVGIYSQNRFIVDIPNELAKDFNFPFEDGEEVAVIIDDRRVVIEKKRDIEEGSEYIKISSFSRR